MEPYESLSKKDRLRIVYYQQGLAKLLGVWSNLGNSEFERKYYDFYYKVVDERNNENNNEYFLEELRKLTRNMNKKAGDIIKKLKDDRLKLNNINNN